MSDTIDKIAAAKLIPVIALDNAADAGPLGEALYAGGLPTAEITFRTAAAEESIRRMAKNPNLLVGAGTVLDVETVKRAVGAGAKFIVSPGFSSRVVSYCVDNNILITPGTVTPSEIQMAIEHGLTVVKFFPSESFGGIKTIKALAAPFSHMRFIPTGGITESLLLDYMCVKSVLAVGGSWFCSKELINGKRFAEITRLTAAAIKITKEVRP